MTFEHLPSNTLPQRDSNVRVPQSGAFSQMLRSSSRRAHTRAERRFQPFLKDPVAQLPFFLSAQLCAHNAVINRMPRVRPEVSRLISVLRDDCLAMGGQVVTLPFDGSEGDRSLHPLAVNYLIFGARKGIAVIKRLLENNGYPGTLPYVQDFPAYDIAWSETVSELDAIAPSSLLRGQITRDVDAGFLVFDHATKACLPLLKPRTIF